MCSYNSVNGQPSCANDWLLKTVLRESWNFDGYVTSDCDAEGDAAMHTRYPDANDAVRAIVGAGTDVDCGHFMAASAMNAIGNGTVTEADFDVLLLRQFRVRLRLGHFDTSNPLAGIGAADICTPEAQELARDGARQSTVLAKNAGGLLPLNAASFSKAVVIGPLLNLTDTVRCECP